MQKSVEEETVKGTVEGVLFTSEKSGYTVCVIDNGHEMVTAVGTMPFLTEGETVSVRGEWVNHPTFGRQFKVRDFEKSDFADSVDMLRYLSSGAVKGIGPITAKRIVERFGDETAAVLEEHWDYLTDITGISKKRAKEIHEDFSRQFGLRSVMMFFGRYFGAALSVKIFKRYGAAATELVKKDPYRLCRDINGIGFDKADRMANELGIASDAPERIAARLRQTLTDAAYGNGHCCVSGVQLVSHTAQALSADELKVASVMRRMAEDKELIAVTGQSDDMIYLPEFYKAETYVAAKLFELSRTGMPLKLTGIEETIDDLQQRYGIVYDDEQRKAIMCAVTKGLTVVTGGPGTGKTTVIKAIIDIFTQLKFSFVLAAPTGRAAKRMAEMSGTEAKTIHRLLEWEYSEDLDGSFRRNEDEPLQCGAVIIDETSMVDILLMEALLRAIKPGTYLIFIGDVDQLPPVGAGNCLSDIIGSGAFPVCRLKKIFRQAEKSLIVVNAHRINAGEMPYLNIKNNDFFFIPETNAPGARELIISLCTKRLPATYGIDPLTDIQVITPTRKGELGTAELNKALQAALNPQNETRKREKKYGNVVFREGDKVMQTRNDYDVVWRKGSTEGTGVFNGDIGVITSIDLKSGSMKILFDDRVADYDFMMLEELEHAYAITVHKGQGSEYRFVILPAFACPRQLMTRSLLYTAVTRAREMVIVVGSGECVRYMTENDQRPSRNTRLKAYLERRDER